MTTMRLTRAVVVMLFAGIAFLSAASVGAAASAAPAGTQVVSLAEGQRLALKEGGYLTLKRGQLTLVNRAGAAKIFPGGSKVAQDNRGQVSIWGTGGTTVVGMRNFDDPLFRTKQQGFDDPLFKPSSGAVNRAGAQIDPALPGNVNRAGVYVDPALPRLAQPRPIVTPNPAVLQSQGPPIRPLMTKLGYFHVCQAGYHLPNGGGISGYLATATPVICVR